MCCDLGRVSSSPYTSVSPFSFVWLVCLIWNLFQEGCLVSCAGLGHWHLSSPLQEDWLGAFVSSQHWPPASVPTSRVTRDHQLSIRGQADLSPHGITPSQPLPERIWHLLFHSQGWEVEVDPHFEQLLQSPYHLRSFKMKALTLRSGAVSLWWVQLAPNVGHGHEKPQGLEFVSVVCGYVCVCDCQQQSQAKNQHSWKAPSVCPSSFPQQLGRYRW